MESSVRASVIVVTYNHANVIGRCLSALVATIGDEDEILIVDNASQDATRTIVQTRYPDVRLIACSNNRGFGSGCNVGARAALGARVAFVNPDTVAQPGWLDALIRVLETEDGNALVTAKVLLQDQPERIDAFGNEVHISGITTSRRWGELAASHTEREAVNAISGACFAVQRDVFWKLGGFDERLFLYFEDTELSLRARLAGYGCLAEPQSVVLHAHQPGFSPTKLRFLERNRWWTLLKLCQWRTLRTLVPALALAEVLVWAMAFRFGPRHVAAKAAAWFDVLAWLPELHSTRAAVSSLRVVSDIEVWKQHLPHLPLAQVSQNRWRQVGERVIERMFRALA
jgi:GT2 family glycosyltransferase